MALTMQSEKSQIACSKDKHYYGSTISEINNPDSKINNEKENKGIYYNITVGILQHVVTVAALSICTYAGVTIRIYLMFFSEWDEIGEFPSFWAQILGTLIIGIIAVHKEKMQDNYMIVYIAISTGLCGSLTTFSSWNAEAAKLLLQVNHTTLIRIQSREHDVRVVGYIFILFIGVGMPASAYIFGKNISLFILKIVPKLNSQSLLTHKIHSYLLPICIFVAYFAITSTLIGISIYYSSYALLFSLLFGSIGTYIRWLLSGLDRLNCICIRGFPMGTLLANTLGSVVLSFATIASARVVQNGSVEQLKVDLLTGVSVGFCGSLTTVSTFITQLVSLPFWIAVVYSLVSLIIVQSVFITMFCTCI